MWFADDVLQYDSWNVEREGSCPDLTPCAVLSDPSQQKSPAQPEVEPTAMRFH